MFRHRSLKLIFRHRLKFCITVGLFFVIYQLSLFNQLTDVFRKHNLIRGTHTRQDFFYEPDDDNMFKCIESGERIHFSKVNDDYCDCLDGTDEPGTNACPNGIFYCSKQISAITKRTRNFIPSSMVNDGICDCCDGSDEWLHMILPFRLTGMCTEQFIFIVIKI